MQGQQHKEIAAERAFRRKSADTYMADWNEAKAVTQQTATLAVGSNASVGFDCKADNNVFMEGSL